jgi:hypothetical protein
MSNQTAKRCTACHRRKPTACFGKRADTSDGLACTCRRCRAIAHAIRQGKIQKADEWDDLYGPDRESITEACRQTDQPARVQTTVHRLASHDPLTGRTIAVNITHTTVHHDTDW